jgi:hypothetical protein
VFHECPSVSIFVEMVTNFISKSQKYSMKH